MTKMRHMAASLVSGVLPEGERGDLARLMQHSSATQQRTYNKCLATNKNIRISNIMRKICTEGTVEAGDLEKAQFGWYFL